LSIVEAKDYPIYSTMFHPEKLAYEWHPSLDIPHDKKQIEFAYEYVYLFAEEARKNPNVCEEAELFIYNFELEYWNEEFLEVYVLDAPN
jgi:hypothetical protein